MLARVRALGLSETRAPQGGESLRQRWRAARQARAVSATNRLRLAESIERMIERSATWQGGLTAAVPIQRDASGDARAALLDLAERLRGPRPVTVDGMVMVRRLLSDGCGPLYLHAGPGELRSAALTVLSALDGAGARR